MTLINFVFLNVVTYCRYCHYGRVCSGDYLYTDKPTDVEWYGYVNVEGTWLQMFTVASWVKAVIMGTFFAIFKIKQVPTEEAKYDWINLIMGNKAAPFGPRSKSAACNFACFLVGNSYESLKLCSCQQTVRDGGWNALIYAVDQNDIALRSLQPLQEICVARPTNSRRHTLQTDPFISNLPFTLTITACRKLLHRWANNSSSTRRSCQWFCRMVAMHLNLRIANKYKKF